MLKKHILQSSKNVPNQWCSTYSDTLQAACSRMVPNGKLQAACGRMVPNGSPTVQPMCMNANIWTILVFRSAVYMINLHHLICNSITYSEYNTYYFKINLLQLIITKCFKIGLLYYIHLLLSIYFLFDITTLEKKMYINSLLLQSPV